jgi:hypothetical protein
MKPPNPVFGLGLAGYRVSRGGLLAGPSPSHTFVDGYILI